MGQTIKKIIRRYIRKKSTNSTNNASAKLPTTKEVPIKEKSDAK